MGNARAHASRWRQMLTLTSGLLLLAGMSMGVLRWAQARTQPVRRAADTGSKSSSASVVPFDQVRVINEQIEAQWEANGITPSRRCSDYEFIRRASLDIIGRIARPQEITRFLKDPPQTRRLRLIERLLASDEYAHNWANLWTVWLMTRSANDRYHNEMQLWLENQFAKKPGDPEYAGWDGIATKLLTATGKSDDNGSVNFILTNLGMANPPEAHGSEGYFDFVPLTSRTTRLFLGLQTQCTQCHDHPFNPDWKQSHFWGINAFFRQVKGTAPVAMMRRGMMAPALSLTDDPGVNKDGIIYYEERRGTVKAAHPTFLDGTRLVLPSDNPELEGLHLKPGQTRRQGLAELITKSPYFAKAYVNRMWAHFFSRGFTNPGPPDDFGDHNPVTHPMLPREMLDKLKKAAGDVPEDLAQELQEYNEDKDRPRLLDYLAQEFKNYKYDTRQLILWICNSEPYQLSSVANRTNAKADAEPFFSRMGLKAMSPEELFESLRTATQADAGETAQAKQKLRDQWIRNLVVNFGDDEGNEVTFNGTVVQALLLMNGQQLNDAVTSSKGTVAKAFEAHGAQPSRVLRELYLAALNRLPTSREFREIERELRMQAGRAKSKKDLMGLWEDTFWALLNSNEFMLNH